MKQIAKRQLLLLGCASLTALILSLYDRYGNILTDVISAGKQESSLEKSVLKENERFKQKESSSESEKESETKIETESMATAAVSDTNQKNIRVLLCSDNYENSCHEQIIITATAPFLISGPELEKHCQAGEQIVLTMQSAELAGGSLLFTLEGEGFFQLPYLKRKQECPSYEGSLKVEKREEGLILINTLPLESYLCYVVPSEMPSSYPLEALKAQAICARCYAVQQMENGRCEAFDADLDDSVSYQVYNNIGKTDAATQAVMQTKGLLMKENGQIENALYYSTSCGLRMEDDASDEAVFCSAMENNRESDFEKEEPWYRWNTFFSLTFLNNRIQTAYPDQIGELTNLNILQRSENGRAEILQISGTLGNVCIEGEYAIRKFLQPEKDSIFLQDGSTAPELGLLPSAFFYLTPQYNGNLLSGFWLNGGGYGHGDGMSQNGAKQLARNGENCQEILKYYYGDGVEIACDT